MARRAEDMRQFPSKSSNRVFRLPLAEVQDLGQKGGTFSPIQTFSERFESGGVGRLSLLAAVAGNAVRAKAHPQRKMPHETMDVHAFLFSQEGLFKPASCSKARTRSIRSVTPGKTVGILPASDRCPV